VVKLTVVTKGGGGTENTAAVKGENVKLDHPHLIPFLSLGQSASTVSGSEC
jgi:hypothetical protein